MGWSALAASYPLPAAEDLRRRGRASGGRPASICVAHLWRRPEDHLRARVTRASPPGFPCAQDVGRPGLPLARADGSRELKAYALFFVLSIFVSVFVLPYGCLSILFLFEELLLSVCADGQGSSVAAQ